MPPVLSKPYGRRGRVAQSNAHNRLDRLKKYRQKVSGCFRSEEFAKAYCRISSYLQIMQNKGVNPLFAISMILN
jgi:transposase